VLNVINHSRSAPIVSALETMFYPLLGFSAKSSTVNSKLGTSTPHDVNNLVLRAWNEGLADLFAGIYQGQSDFFTASLPQLAAARDLTPIRRRFWTAADLQRFGGQVSLTDDQLTSIAYTQGTVMARLLYMSRTPARNRLRISQRRILKKARKYSREIGRHGGFTGNGLRRHFARIGSTTTR